MFACVYFFFDFIGLAIFQNKISVEIIIKKILPFEYIKTE